MTVFNNFKNISNNSIVDIIYLDDFNKILVYKNSDNYTMIHYRKIDDEMKEINRWQLSKYLKSTNSEYIKREHNLFLVQSGENCNITDSIYNYVEGRFVLEKGLFDGIGTNLKVTGLDYCVSNIDYLREYGCFLGNFRLHSTKEEDDIISYVSSLTLENVKHDFTKVSDLFFALIDVNGNIKDNKLFYGQNFSRITDVIDLTTYGSLDEFKKAEISKLDKLKRMEKEKYLAVFNSEENSFYKENEVLKILKLK